MRRLPFASRAGLIKTSLHSPITWQFPLSSVPFHWTSVSRLTTQKPQYHQTSPAINQYYGTCGNPTSRSLHYRGVRHFNSSGQRRLVSVDTDAGGVPAVEGGETTKSISQDEEPLMDSVVKKKRSSTKKKAKASYAAGAGTVGNIQKLGFSDWPASPEALNIGRSFLFDAVASPYSVLLVPDRDIDGLSAGTAISLTLQLLGKPMKQIHVHFLRKGRSVFDQFEKDELEKLCQKYKVGHIVMLDQGSREGTESLVSPKPPPNSGAPGRKLLIIDHHYSTSFPPNATVLTPPSHHPTVPASFITYVLCSPLHPTAPAAVALPALIGTLGDPSSTQKTAQMLRSPPFSLYMDTNAALKTYTKKWTDSLISLLNVIRRSPLEEVGRATRAAWQILQFDPHADQTEWPTPKRILSSEMESQWSLQRIANLKALQETSKAEMKKCKRKPPRFSSDGRIAVIEINSPWQIHPLLAVAWARSLGRNDPTSKLLAVLCANSGYMSDKVSFSVRRTAIGVNQDVDLIGLLKEYVNDLMPPILREGMGDYFAMGHKSSSGGCLDKDVWEVYKTQAMKIQEARRTGSHSIEIGDYPI